MCGRVNEVLDTKPSVTETDNTEENGDSSAPAVKFDKVYFSYHDNSEYALEDISFTAEKGQTIGIIGGTGSGKSTLINLIPDSMTHQTVWSKFTEQMSENTALTVFAKR